MTTRFYANAPATTLSSGVTAGATTLPLTAATGLPTQYPFVLILDRSEGAEEIVSVTNVSGLNATVTRGFDSSTAFAHSAGASVEHGVSAIEFREANTHVNADAGVHGVTGDVVGTTDSQAVSNKDLSSATNTFPSTLATVTGAQTLTDKDLSAVSNTFPSTLETVTGSQAKVNTHNAVTNPHSATSAATASRLVLRDAAGRAQVTSPAVAADIATKGYVDAAASDSGWVNIGSAPAGWGTFSARRRLLNGIVYITGFWTRDGAAQLASTFFNLPVGWRPSEITPIFYRHGSVAVITGFISTTGDVNIDSSTVGTGASVRTTAAFPADQ